MISIMKGYKVFNSDWTCRGKQYSCPGVFEENVSLSVCHRGMHFCRRAEDCFNYYNFSSDNHVAEVIAYGDVEEKGDKCCTDKLKIVRELSWHEVLELVNTGKNCTGKDNSGNYNSGNYNSGNYNSGNYNSSGWNSGNWNSGNCNAGNCNSGNCNSGNHNSGNCNSGNWNAGDWNSGNCNNGNWNVGGWNNGDWNGTNYSNGCFNTIKPKITFFNKKSDWTYDDWRESRAKCLLDEIPTETFKWIFFRDMTEEEKEENPDAETTNGYLKIMEPKIGVQEWWNCLSEEDKNTILSIPNFDAEIFKEITGIDVNEED